METINVIKKGGWRMDRISYSEWAKKVFEETILHRRELVTLPAEAEHGARFKNNHDVLIRLESNYSEAEFLACPGPAVDAMLIDAAQSDYWYNHEKDYDNDEEMCDCGEEEDFE